MLHVASPRQARDLLFEKFEHLATGAERVPLESACGRVLAEALAATQDIPGFDRSTVDGYALRAADTFGCSESLPAMLAVAGEVLMGKPAEVECRPGQCVAVPTGGQMPKGADAAVMVEHTEDYGGGTIGVTKPAAPGQHIIYSRDDVAAGQQVFAAGKRLTASDIGALAALGIAQVPVAKPPVVGILSTGDEIIPSSGAPTIGQVRDVNAPLLHACAAQTGGTPRGYGICGDDYGLLTQTIGTMAAECDVVLLSGGSSVGTRDAVQRAVEQLGTLHLHGIAIKPGKPTIFGEVDGKPLIGLPGHPVAVYFIYTLFVAPLLRRMLGEKGGLPRPGYTAKLASAIPSNHGREEYIAVRLEAGEAGLLAHPIMSKSGLITQLSRAEGYLQIPRDREGYAPGDTVQVTAL
ncbi:molybdopterin molybdenumtransferase MoeA [Ruminococcaceae bacterium OttesenSCG-928-A11]|nr:molybdopterin molybdenumtransferase MoeA [Ruminococcaceae bacterium OttesenSCG-928-A11]